MGVIIGSLNDGSVPCVESPDSPKITIGKPTAQFVKSISGSLPLGQYGMISPCREVKLSRKFTARKMDLSSTLQWLSSIEGSYAKLNCGADGERYLRGDFYLDGEIDGTPTSPTLMEVSANFISTILDCNFILPSGLSIVKIDATDSAIKIDGAIRQTYSSREPGDESGLMLKPGPIHFPDEIGGDLEDGFLRQQGVTISAEADPDFVAVNIHPYRAIDLCINGEVAKRWWIPCNAKTRYESIYARNVYYGITNAEYAESGVPMMTDLIDLMDGGNERLSGEPMDTGRLGVAGPYPWRSLISTPIPSGAKWSSWYGYTDILESGSWAANRSGWNIHRPYEWQKYHRYYLIGQVWEVVKYREVRDKSGRVVPYFTDEQCTVRLGWVSDSERIKLVAVDPFGGSHDLMDFLR